MTLYEHDSEFVPVCMQIGRSRENIQIRWARLCLCVYYYTVCMARNNKLKLISCPDVSAVSVVKKVARTQRERNEN